jgi:hypothetical protein
VFKSVVDAVLNAGMIVLPCAFRINSLEPSSAPTFAPFRRMLGGVPVARLTGSDEVRFSAAVDCNSQLRALAIRRPVLAKPAIPNPACCYGRHKNSSVVELCRSVRRKAHRRQGSHRQGNRGCQGGTKNSVQIFIFFVSINKYLYCHPLSHMQAQM